MIAEGARDRQVNFGADLLVIDEQDGWAWVQSDLDDYVGYLPAGDLAPVAADATHMASAIGMVRKRSAACSAGKAPVPRSGRVESE